MYPTPGVYFEQVDRARPALGPLRTDIAGILGYAERGPLLAPVKLHSWRQFTAVFGAPLTFAHLPYAVRGFFENGGAALYVIRVADPDAAVAARANLADEATAALEPAAHQTALRLWASHGELQDPVTEAPAIVDGQPARLNSPGAWGNRLAVSLSPGGLAATEVTDQPADGYFSDVLSLSGLELGSIIRLSQGGAVAPAFRQIAAIDPLRRRLTWNEPLTGLGLDLAPGAAPLTLESVEFDLELFLDGQLVERHRDLSLSAIHSRYAVRRLQADSAYLDAALYPDEVGPPPLLQPERHPAPVDRQPLASGADGLASVDKADFLAALEALARIDEISLLTAPDLVLRPALPAPPVAALPPGPDCSVLTAPPAGRLQGAIYLAGAETLTPVVGATILPLNTNRPPVTSDADGRFDLTGLAPGLISLRLEKAGFLTLETTSLARTFWGADETVDFFLSLVSLPPALADDDVYDVQAAMIAQGEQGGYRVALLDPPAADLGLEEIQTWRARFDSSYAALYYPWLQVSADGAAGDVRDLPPSGHVAGLIARTDLSQGVHRAPANFVLDGVKAFTRPVDAAAQGLLNPLGINCLRALPGRGLRVYGARTLSSDPEWRFLNVRRLLLMIEEAVEEGHQWAVFEPNNTILRQAIRFSLSAFLNALWRAGALAGETPDAAYRVKCDEDNNPPAVVDAGQLIADVAVAPTVPFEFIIFRLGRTVDAVEVSESPARP